MPGAILFSQTFALVIAPPTLRNVLLVDSLKKYFVINGKVKRLIKEGVVVANSLRQIF
jgi:hypothetical protein